MKVLILDNYDSFTFNLYYYLEELVDEVIVMRNDEVIWDEVDTCDGIVLSPGPGLPSEAGSLMRLIERYAESKPILGVCLGHQAIAEHFGAELKNMPQVLHGQATECSVLKEDFLFEGCGKQFLVGHYHSWVIDESTLPDNLICTSRNESGDVMSIKHERLPIHGVQFHPESILTPLGKKMISNWVKTLTRS